MRLTHGLFHAIFFIGQTKNMLRYLKLYKIFIKVLALRLIFTTPVKPRKSIKLGKFFLFKLGMVFSTLLNSVFIQYECDIFPSSTLNK